MKRLFCAIIGSLVLVMTPIIGSFTRGVSNKIYIPVETSHVLETLTVYNPTTNQCDATPLITASNQRIDLKLLSSQKLRWMALSRNLLKRWNGEFNYGDTVIISSGDPQIDGPWVIQDNLNKRYTNRGDLLFATNVRTLGKWKNVRITKTRYQAFVTSDAD
jgi:hypothetical protein